MNAVPIRNPCGIILMKSFEISLLNVISIIKLPVTHAESSGKVVNLRLFLIILDLPSGNFSQQRFQHSHSTRNGNLKEVHLSQPTTNPTRTTMRWSVMLRRPKLMSSSLRLLHNSTRACLQHRSKINP